MDVISYSLAAKAFTEADAKIQQYVTDEAGMPTVADLQNGDEWLNTDTGRTMIVFNGVFVEKPSTPAAVVGVQDKLDLKANSVDFNQVDNTSDADKPVSIAQQTALDLKANQSTTYTKTEIDTKVDYIGTVAAFEAQLS